MSQLKLDAYLYFSGNCREAMEFYKDTFGGTLHIQTFDEAPGDHDKEMAGKVMHARLTDGDISLMASDAPSHETLGIGKIQLSISGDDEQRLRTLFDALGAEGKVTYVLTKEFWGDIFGTLTDKFGVEWMVNIEQNEKDEQ